MKLFTIYPAIDLRAGRVVRLTQGRKEDAKYYSILPSSAAEMWIEQGAEWLHVVNLDGAFGDDSQPNLVAIKAIVDAAKGMASIQVGGGLHSLAAIESMLDLGAARVIVGTAAVSNPILMRSALETFSPERIVLGIDARDNLVRVSGWEQATALTPIELAERYLKFGLQTIIFTNISQDGMGSGVDISATKALADETQIEVIASGGVGSLDDIRLVKTAQLPGVVVGKALYENIFTLMEAIGC